MDWEPGDFCHLSYHHAMVTDSYPAFMRDTGEVIYKEGCT